MAPRPSPPPGKPEVVARLLLARRVGRLRRRLQAKPQGCKGCSFFIPPKSRTGIRFPYLGPATLHANQTHYLWFVNDAFRCPNPRAPTREELNESWTSQLDKLKNGLGSVMVQRHKEQMHSSIPNLYWVVCAANWGQPTPVVMATSSGNNEPLPNRARRVRQLPPGPSLLKFCFTPEAPVEVKTRVWDRNRGGHVRYGRGGESGGE